MSSCLHLYLYKNMCISLHFNWHRQHEKGKKKIKFEITSAQNGGSKINGLRMFNSIHACMHAGVNECKYSSLFQLINTIEVA